MADEEYDQLSIENYRQSAVGALESLQDEQAEASAD